MSIWRFRQRGGSGEVQQLQAEMLLLLIEGGDVGDQFEFLPPGGPNWLPFSQTFEMLVDEIRTARPPAPKPRESSPWADTEEGPPSRVGQPSMPHESAGGHAQSDVSTAPATPTSSPTERRGQSWTVADEIDMTPMIDMTFLLLVFFMVAATIAPWRQVSVPMATSGDTQDPQNRVVLVLDFPGGLEQDELESMNGSRHIQLAGARLCFIDMANQGPRPEDGQVSPDQLQTALEREFGRKPAAQFILLAHRKMPTGVVREVLKTAKQAGAKETLVGVSTPR